MKSFKTILFAIILLLPLLMVANTGKPTGKHTKEKNIHKEFTISEDTELRLFNSYGNIDISTWNKDKVEVKIQIIVNGDNETSVNSDLELINIHFEEILKRKWLIIETKNMGGIKNHKEVHYQIKVPRSNPLHVFNIYGDITLGKIDADIKMNISYGNILADELNGSTVISTSYSQRTTINFAKGIDLFTNFSDINIKNAGAIFVGEMNSSNINIEKIENLIYQGNYGSLNVGLITKRLKIISASNVNMNFAKLSDESIININAKYGTIKIDYWTSKETNINTYGSRVTLGYTEREPFDLNLSLMRMDEMISTPFTVESLNLPKAIQESLIKKSNHEFLGYHLKRNSGNNLTLKLNGGILHLKKVK